jgi:hypothetical protein
VEIDVFDIRLLKMKKKLPLISSLCVVLLLLSGCDQERKQEIKPATRPSSDATALAKEAWVMINQLDQLLYAGETEHLQEGIRDPLRELSTQWRIEVKMTDAVAEGRYALCRKSLVSLDTWTRAVMAKESDVLAKQKSYERDKALCKDAIAHPEQGNSPDRVF